MQANLHLTFYNFTFELKTIHVGWLSLRLQKVTQKTIRKQKNNNNQETASQKVEGKKEVTTVVR